MDQIQEKIDLFADHLHCRTKNEHDSIISSAQKKQDDKMKSAEIALQTEKRNLEERNYQMIFRDKNRIIASGINQAKNDRLCFNHQIQEDFSQTLLNLSKKRSDSDSYDQYFKNAIASIPKLFGDHKDLVFTVSEKDKSLLVKHIAETLIDYHTSIHIDDQPDIANGGFTVCDLGEHFFCDFTIAHLLRENNQKIGKFLTDKMAPYNEGEAYDE